MGQLSDLAKERTPYFTMELGETVRGIYKGFKMVPSTFDPEKDNFRFIIEVNGKNKFWDTSSNKIALVFDKIPEGSVIDVTKSQDGLLPSGKPRFAWEIKLVDMSPPEKAKK